MGLLHLTLGVIFILFGIHVVDKAHGLILGADEKHLYTPHKVYGYMNIAGGAILLLGGIWELLQ